MYIVKRVGLLAIFLLAGAIIMYIFGRASLQGAFNQWEPLGKPPGNAVKFVAFDYVQTASGDIYVYDYKEGCTDDCWVISITPTPDDSEIRPSFRCLQRFTCTGLGQLCGFTDSLRTYGVGLSMTIEAIDKKGFVYSWRYGNQ